MDDASEIKRLKRAFVKSVVNAMRIKEEHEKLWSKLKPIPVKKEDFEPAENEYSTFMAKLKAYIEENNIQTSIVSDIEKAVAKIDKDVLLNKYNQFASTRNRVDFVEYLNYRENLYKGLGVFLSNLLTYNKNQSRFAFYERTYYNELLKELNYYELIKKAGNIVERFDLLDQQMGFEARDQHEL